MHRFFLLDQQLIIGSEVDLAPISHQLLNVLRLQPSELIGLLNGDGYLYETEIIALNKKGGIGRVLKKYAVDSEPITHVSLYQCSLKADKFEWILQKGTELGVSRFVPIISERCVVRPENTLVKKYPRWRKIIQEAAEQSGRTRLPTLAAPSLLKEALPRCDGFKLVAWEATSPANSTSSLEFTLSRYIGEDVHNQISLLIGPEGGLTYSEVEDARAHGWHVASLGPRTLRAETAAIATVAIMLNKLG